MVANWGKGEKLKKVGKNLYNMLFIAFKKRNKKKWKRYDRAKNNPTSTIHFTALQFQIFSKVGERKWKKNCKIRKFQKHEIITRTYLYQKLSLFENFYNFFFFHGFLENVTYCVFTQFPKKIRRTFFFWETSTWNGCRTSILDDWTQYFNFIRHR